MRCGSPVVEGAERCSRCGEELVLVILGAEQAAGERPAAPSRTASLRGVAFTMTVALVVGALWLTQRSGQQAPLPAPTASVSPDARTGAAPLQFGRIYLCPFGMPYQAYPSGSYFPANHPLVPPRTQRPDRCFSTSQQAEAEGYSLAAPPLGAQLVAGIYLVPVDLDDQCARAASHLGFRVPCPTRLPGPGVGSSPTRCGDPTSFGTWTHPPCAYQGAFFLLDQAGFALAPGAGTGAFGGPDLIFLAYRQARPGSHAEGADLFSCPQGREVGSTYIRPLNAPLYSPVVFIDCPPTFPPMSEHLIIRGTYRGIVYEIAIQADPRADRRLLQAIASGVRFVGPRQDPAP